MNVSTEQLTYAVGVALVLNVVLDEGDFHIVTAVFAQLIQMLKHLNYIARIYHE